MKSQSRHSKIFLKILFLFSITIPFYIAIQYYICTNFDEYYWASTGTSNTLITGTSMTRNGINPNILKEKLNLQVEPKNIALNGMNSPYGALYTDFIKKKIRDTSAENLFIIETSLFGLVNKCGETGMEREKETPHYKLWNVKGSINWEYLIKYYSPEHPHFHLLLQSIVGTKTAKERIIHSNGWTEIRLNEKNKDRNRLIPLKCWKPIEERTNHFKQLVTDLSRYGKVFLVKMPVDWSYQHHPQTVIPNLDSLVNSLIQEKNCYLLDYSSKGKNYSYHDYGTHLDHFGANAFTKHLSNDILEILE